MEAWSFTSRRAWMKWTSLGAVLSVVALAWLGYRAIAQWQQSAELAAQRSADASADLLFTALTRDMRGVQRTVLSALQVEDDGPSVALDLNAVASAFARYPYPEAFFVARIGDRGSTITFYRRTNRRPAWLPDASPDMPFPVVTITEPPIAGEMLRRIDVDVRKHKLFSAFDARLAGATCQIFALLTYPDLVSAPVSEVRGFVVDLDWVRQNYFQGLTSQVGRMRGADPGLRLAVMDAGGAIRAGMAGVGRQAASSTRPFPLLFFDRAMVDLDPPPDLATEWWVADARMTDARGLSTARAGARATLVLLSISALVLAAALGLSASAVQARARLTETRSDFVAAVTHELKTPTATIQTISESFVRRAHVDDNTRRDYGKILLHEAKRLTRLVDNLLAYSRISDVTDAYAFKPTRLSDVVRRSLDEFRFRIESDGFALSVDVPTALPPVRADVVALSLALGNVLDNAIRYSDERRRLALHARVVDEEVMLDVADAGAGIPPDEIAKVTQKFFRGESAASGGTGLGLAITRRIIADHGGRLQIRSDVGVGTTVTLFLPVAEERDDAHSDR